MVIAHEGGQRVAVTVLRSGASQTMMVRLGGASFEPLLDLASAGSNQKFDARALQLSVITRVPRIRLALFNECACTFFQVARRARIAPDCDPPSRRRLPARAHRYSRKGIPWSGAIRAARFRSCRERVCPRPRRVRIGDQLRDQPGSERALRVDDLPVSNNSYATELHGPCAGAENSLTPISHPRSVDCV